MGQEDDTEEEGKGDGEGDGEGGRGVFGAAREQEEEQETGEWNAVEAQKKMIFQIRSILFECLMGEGGRESKGEKGVMKIIELKVNRRSKC